jgi:AbrB family looped-hinge helix DNA binding protein
VLDYAIRWAKSGKVINANYRRGDVPMVMATMTSRGRITIPKSVRNALRLRAGNRVEIRMQGDGEAILKRATMTVDEVFGMLHRPGMRRKSVGGDE